MAQNPLFADQIIKLARKYCSLGRYNDATSALTEHLQQYVGKDAPLNVRLELALTAMSQGNFKKARETINNILSGRQRDLLSLPADNVHLILSRLLWYELDLRCGEVTAGIQTYDSTCQQVWEEHLEHLRPDSYTEELISLEFRWHDLCRVVIERGGKIPAYSSSPDMAHRLVTLHHYLFERHEYQYALRVCLIGMTFGVDMVSQIEGLDDIPPAEAAMFYRARGELEEAEASYRAANHSHGFIDVRFSRLMLRVFGQPSVPVQSLDDELTNIVLLYTEADFPLGALDALHLYLSWKSALGASQQSVHKDLVLNLEHRSGAKLYPHVTGQDISFQESHVIPEQPVEISNPTEADSEGLTVSRVVPMRIHSLGLKQSSIVSPANAENQGSSSMPKRRHWLNKTRSPASRAINFINGEFSEERLSASGPLSIVEFSLLTRNIFRALSNPTNDDESLARKIQVLQIRMPPIVRDIDPEWPKTLELLRDAVPLRRISMDHPTGRGPHGPIQVIEYAEGLLRKWDSMNYEPSELRGTFKLAASALLVPAYARIQDPAKAQEYARLGRDLAANHDVASIFETLAQFQHLTSHGAEKAELHRMKREFERRLEFLREPWSLLPCCLILAWIEGLHGDRNKALRWVEKSRELARTSGLDTVQSISVEFQCRFALVSLNSQEEDLDALRTELQNFELSRQSQPVLAKKVAYVAACGYFLLGYVTVDRALPHRGLPIKMAEAIHEARLYYQAALGAAEFSDEQFDTKHYSQYVWGVGETWKYEGMALKNPHALQIALREFRTAENFLNEARRQHGLTDTDFVRAFYAKQHITGRFDTIRLFRDAFVCSILGYTYATNDVQRGSFLQEAWQMIQRQKARSVMDILGSKSVRNLGMSELLRQFPEQYALLEREESLLEDLSRRAYHDRSTVLNDLQELRHRMKDHFLLDSIVRSRNGESFHVGDLMDIGHALGPSSNHVVYVDWIENNGLIFVFTARVIISRWEIRFRRLDIQIQTVSAWIKSSLNKRVFSNTDLAHVKLKELSNLVAPLSDMTNPGDLLVLCPAGPLHQLPLHALEIENNRILLERNPVLYTASLSILRLGIFRAALPNYDTQSWKAAVLSVYEESDPRNPPEEVSNVLSSISALADSLGTKAQFGSNVTVRTYNEHVSDASLVHFHGHAILATRAEDQALILHGSDTGGVVPRQASHHLTVRKIFSTTKFTRDPLVVNIACSSGSSMIMPGDEPFGLTAAFLYAGAKAVVGSLWSIRSADGRAFSNYFYENLRIQAAESETHVVDLARAVQQSVLMMRDEETTEAPFHWAPFIMSGFWQHRFDPSGIAQVRRQH